MTRCRVLVAEDNAGLREILVEGLTDEGFEIVAAEDGGRAWELASTGGFDALLLDEEMPVMTGRQLLLRLRERGDETPALIISGNLLMTEEERRRLRVGPVIRKPASIAMLAGALWRACGIDPSAGAASVGGKS